MSETGDCPFRDFMKSLKHDPNKADTVLYLVRALEELGDDLVHRPLAKPLTGGLFELKSPRGRGVTLRVFYAKDGDGYVLFNGYDKGRRPTTKHQNQQIDIAKGHLAAHRAGR